MLVMSIQAPVFNVLGSGMPGNSGTSVSQEGALNSGMDVTWQLKQKAAAFAEAYAAGAPKTQISALAADLEGLLMTEQLVQVLTPKETQTLVEALHALLES